MFKNQVKMLDRFEHTKKAYIREWNTDHKGKDSQGPGKYDVTDLGPIKPIKNIRIPLQDRGLLKVKKDLSPSPVSYNVTFDMVLNAPPHPYKDGLDRKQSKESLNSSRSG